MPINVFGNSNSNDKCNKIDISMFVQKPYLRTNYIESNLEEDIDLKNQYRIKNLPDPNNIKDACNKNYVDNAINETSLVRNNKDNDFGDYKLTNINSIILNTQAVNDNEGITKAYVDQFHQENERSRRDVGLDFYNESNDLVKNNQDNDFNDNKLTNIDSVTVNRGPSSDNELANKKYVDDEIDKNTLVRYNQTLSNYLKVSVGNDIYNLTKYDKIKLSDVTEIRAPSSGSDLLQKWKITNRNSNNEMKIGKFLKSTKTSSPTEDTGATSLPPIGNAFMYVESSSNNSGNHTYVMWERTDIIQFTNVTFYYNRYSILTDDSLKGVGRLRIQLMNSDNTRHTIHTMAENSQYNTSSTKWSLINLDMARENYGIRFNYDRIRSPHCDTCFSDITITHSVY